MKRTRSEQAGFTLIELMVTVAVILILAAIALPSFFSESRRTRALAEVQPIFNDLRVRLEQYVQENGHYPATIGEATLHPAGAPGVAARAINPLPAAWQGIKARISGNDQIYCGYTWATGLANEPANIGPVAAAAPFEFTAPEIEWYYLLAQCDLDGDGTFSFYFTSSSNPAIEGLREGE